MKRLVLVAAVAMNLVVQVHGVESPFSESADAKWNYGEDFEVLMFAGLSEEEDLAFEEAERLGETNQLIQLIGGELLAYAATELEEATSHERGYFMGRVCFELMMAIGPLAAAGKADKVKVLEKLDAIGTPADLKGAKAEIYTGLLNRSRVLFAKLLHTPQCFVARTPVLVRGTEGEFGQDLQDEAGLGRQETQKAQKGIAAVWVPIERVTLGIGMWARDEVTGRVGLARMARAAGKPVWMVCGRADKEFLKKDRHSTASLCCWRESPIFPRPWRLPVNSLLRKSAKPCNEDLRIRGSSGSRLTPSLRRSNVAKPFNHGNLPGETTKKSWKTLSLLEPDARDTPQPFTPHEPASRRLFLLAHRLAGN